MHHYNSFEKILREPLTTIITGHLKESSRLQLKLITYFKSDEYEVLCEENLIIFVGWYPAFVKRKKL